MPSGSRWMNSTGICLCFSCMCVPPCRLPVAGSGPPAGKHTIDHEQAVRRIADALELLDNLVDGRLLLDLLLNEPVQEDFGRVVFLRFGQLPVLVHLPRYAALVLVCSFEGCHGGIPLDRRSGEL